MTDLEVSEPRKGPLMSGLFLALSVLAGLGVVRLAFLETRWATFAAIGTLVVVAGC